MLGDISPLSSIVIGVAAAGAVKVAEVAASRLFDGVDKRNAVYDADVALVRQVIFETRDIAKNYWNDDGRDPESEGALSGRLLFVGRVCDGMFGKNQTLLRSIQVCVNRFDRACTRGQFGTSTREAEPGRCADIEQAAYTLVYEVTRCRRKL